VQPLLDHRGEHREAPVFIFPQSAASASVLAGGGGGDTRRDLIDFNRGGRASERALNSLEFLYSRCRRRLVQAAARSRKSFEESFALVSGGFVELSTRCQASLEDSALGGNREFRGNKRRSFFFRFDILVRHPCSSIIHLGRAQRRVTLTFIEYLTAASPPRGTSARSVSRPPPPAPP